MPNYPVHNYGLDKMAQWIMPAMAQKQKETKELSKEERDRMSTLLWKSYDHTMKIKEPSLRKTAIQSVLNPAAEKAGYGANLFDAFATKAENDARFKGAAEKGMASAAQEFESATDFAGKRAAMKKLATFTTDWRNRFEEDHPTYALQVREWTSALMKGDIAKYQAQRPLSEQEKENIAAKKQAGLSPREKAFEGLSPEEKKTALLKPDVQVNIAEKESAKERALLKTARFRATVQKDVMSLNKDQWIRMSPTERTDAVRVETDKRVRQTYPDAKYGEIKGKKGWYIQDSKGAWLLVSPWNE